MGRTFDVADLRNHISKVQPIYIIYNNYSNIIKIEIIEILGFEFIPKFIVVILMIKTLNRFVAEGVLIRL